MAHLIDQSTGKAAIFVTGQPAWHGLGTVVREAQTSDEAIRLAGLDWRVEQFPVFTRIEGQEVETDRLANVRMDSQAVLGVVGTGYTPFQNRDCFDFMDSIVQEKLAMFETAGALKGGRQVWMMARLPKVLRAAGEDVIHPYLLLTTGHDGSMGIRMIPTTVRVVCWNTLSLALNRASADQGLCIRHTENLESRVRDARQKLGIIIQRMDRFEQEAQALAKRRLSQDELGRFFAKLVEDRAERQQRRLLETFVDKLHNERNCLPGIEHSAWAAYNAVSEWADHELTVHGQGRQRQENRLYSAWFGSANAIKQRAYEQALALAI